MKRTIQCVVCLYLLAASAHAQQIASVDLTKQPEPVQSIDRQNKSALPHGCKKLSGGGVADGIVTPQDHQRRQIVVEVLKVSEDKASEGTQLQADIQLRNNGEQAIRIPWSNDPGTIKTGQHPDNLQWEEGWFEFMLRAPRGHDVLLKSLSQSLYGSDFSAGSQLTIRPGEWITATVKFKLEAMYLYQPGEFKGNSQLMVEWEQTARSWSVRDCSVWNGYFSYTYEQRSPSITVEIMESSSTNKRPGSE